MFSLILIIVVVTSIWVAADASSRNFKGGKFSFYGSFGWLIGCLLLWIVVFPVYLAQRNRAPLKQVKA